MVLGLLLCCSCGKTLKSISASVSGIPSDPGGYLDIGNGYDADIDWQKSTFLSISFGVPADEIESNIVQMSGDTVKFCYKLSEQEKNGRKLSKFSVSDYTFMRLHKTEMGEYSDERYLYFMDSDIPTPVYEDNSDYKEGYVWDYVQVTYTLDSPGLYFYQILGNWIVIRKT